MYQNYVLCVSTLQSRRARPWNQARMHGCTISMLVITTRAERSETRTQDLPMSPTRTISEKPPIADTSNALDDWKRPADEEIVVPDANPFAGPGVSNWQQGDVQNNVLIAANNKKTSDDEREGVTSR